MNDGEGKYVAAALLLALAVIALVGAMMAQPPVDSILRMVNAGCLVGIVAIIFLSRRKK